MCSNVGPGPPAKTRLPVPEEENVVFLLCKQDDEVFMLEVHMKDGSCPMSAAKHMLRIAEGSSGTKVLQCFSSSECFEISDLEDLDIVIDSDEDDDDGDENGDDGDEEEEEEEVLLEDDDGCDGDADESDDEDEDETTGRYRDTGRLYLDNDTEPDEGSEILEDDIAMSPPQHTISLGSHRSRRSRPNSSGSAISTSTLMSLLSGEHLSDAVNLRSQGRREAASVSRGTRSDKISSAGFTNLITTPSLNSRPYSPISPATSLSRASSAKSVSRSNNNGNNGNNGIGNLDTQTVSLLDLLYDAEVVFSMGSDANSREIRLSTPSRVYSAK
eukprot:jgi/Hompol1/3554/HPOL_006611-RA